MTPAVVAVCGILGAVAGRFALRCADRFERDETLLTAVPPEGGFLRRLKWEFALSARSVRTTWADACTVTPRERRLLASTRPWHHLPLLGRWLPGNPYRCGSAKSEFGRWSVELVTALLFAAVAYVDFERPLTPIAGPLREAMPADGLTPWCRLVGHVVLVWALVVATVTDLRTMTIPDGSTVPAGLFAILWATLTARLVPVPVWFEDPSFGALLTGGAGNPGTIAVTALVEAAHLHGLVASLAGLLAGGGIVWTVRILGGWALGREAMGFGDVVLLAMVGAFLGWQATAAVFFLAPACAGIGLIATRALRPSAEFPYGPALAGGALLIVLAWPSIWPAVERACLLGPVLLAVAAIMTAIFGALLFLIRVGKSLAGLDDDWFEPEEITNRPRAAVSADGGDRWPGVAAATGRRGLETWKPR